MKKLLIGLLTLGSLSVLANDIVELGEASRVVKKKIENSELVYYGIVCPQLVIPGGYYAYQQQNISFQQCYSCDQDYSVSVDKVSYADFDEVVSVDGTNYKCIKD